MINNNTDKMREIYQSTSFVDIHCHCLPDIDDGPATMDESISLCRAIRNNCITNVIATAHQLGRYGEYNDADRIREKVAGLNNELKNNEIELNVFPGADVRVDERICKLIEEDKILTLADNGRYILLELPHEIFIDIEPLIIDLCFMGIQPIITHPERHPIIAQRPEVLLGWMEQSAILQITAGSLQGHFGSLAKKSAWQLLSMGWALLVATDAHDSYRRAPMMLSAFESICEKLGREVAQSVCIENPLKVLESRDILSADSVVTRKYVDERV